MNCWICGELANTGEHKIKKSLLNDVFEDDFNNKNLQHYKNDKCSIIQGASSKKIQYLNNLCIKCNNQKTQASDFAFDKFFEYIKNNHTTIFRTKMIDFNEIYGSEYNLEGINLFKYFVKIFGCDLSDNNLKVPIDLVNLLHDKAAKVNLAITFSLKDDYSILENPIATNYGIGSLNTSLENKKTKNETNPFYTFSINLGYITINYFYNISYDVGLGSQWSANHRYIYFGLEYNSFEKLSNDLNHNHTADETLLYNLISNLNKLEKEKSNLIDKTISKIKDVEEFKQKLQALIKSNCL